MKRKEFLKGVATGAALVLLLIALTIIGLKIFNTVRFGFGNGVLNINKLSLLGKLEEVESAIDANGYYEADSKKVEDYIFKGLMAALDDDYSVYYTAEEYQTVRNNNKGIYIGSGIIISEYSDKGIIIKDVYQNSPAAEAGIVSDDIIVSLDGKLCNTMNQEDIKTILRGEKDKVVHFTVERPSTGEKMEMDIKIGEVELNYVTGIMLDDSIGYIFTESYSDATVKQFKDTYNSLAEQGMKALILDVRNNGGGLVDSAVDILDFLLPEGKLLTTKMRNGKSHVYNSDAEAKLTVPCVLLVNGKSASSAEIFAGALKDYGVATLVGEKTYGKGIVQWTYILMDGSAIKFTTEHYFTPFDNDIHQKGIEPDITMVDDPETEDDEQLSEAISILKKSINN